MSDPTPTTPDLLALANRLTVARVRAGLSQAEAARRSGCGRSYLSELENAKHVPNALMLASLADTYGVTVDDLLGRTAVPAPATVDRGAAVRYVRTALSRVDGRDDEVVDALLAAGYLAVPAVPAADEGQVQRVAAAIRAAHNPNTEDWLGEAHAAIAALREARDA